MIKWLFEDIAADDFARIAVDRRRHRCAPSRAVNGARHGHSGLGRRPVRKVKRVHHGCGADKAGSGTLGGNFDNAPRRHSTGGRMTEVSVKGHVRSWLLADIPGSQHIRPLSAPKQPTTIARLDRRLGIQSEFFSILNDRDSTKDDPTD